MKNLRNLHKKAAKYIYKNLCLDFMMLAIISPPDFIMHEAAKLTKMFKVGLKCYHLRKPEATDLQLLEFINQIPHDYWKFIAIHHRPFLAEKLNNVRLHTRYEDTKLHSLASSCSIHSWEQYHALSHSFDYFLLSPIWDSISKKTVKAKFNLRVVPQHDKPVLALGGITLRRIQEAKELGFDGVAVLGAIWNNINPVEQFLQFNKICSCL